MLRDNLQESQCEITSVIVSYVLVCIVLTECYDIAIYYTIVLIINDLLFSYCTSRAVLNCCKVLTQSKEKQMIYFFKEVHNPDSKSS